ncbi:MAG: nucleoside monophosphate kinase [Bryobacterales bacterium]|nr:nucleoside monophosphate kinase [Bryobacterales bacterium]
MGTEDSRERGSSPQLPLFEGSGLRTDGSLRGTGQALGSAVILLGPPGSGKGTQASLLSECLHFPHVSTGDILRDRILIGDDFGKAISSRIDFGQFVPDDWINRLLEERFALADCRHGVILDGYPRTLSQAERLCERIRNAGSREEESAGRIFVVRLDASLETLAARFAGRRQCSACGTLFHLRYQPSLAGARCDRPDCEGTLEERQDDRPEFVARRLTDFERLTAPVIAFLEARADGFVSVEAGNGSPEEILQRVLSGLRGIRPGPVPCTRILDTSETPEFSVVSPATARGGDHS